MPNEFVIQAPTNSLQLNDKRQAEFTYNVYNASGRPLRAQAIIRTTPPGGEGWFDLSPAERDFPISHSEQYQLQITVPPATAAGSYTFALDMLWEGNGEPEQRTVAGQLVTFEVPTVVENTTPWWVYALGGGGLLVLIAIIAILTNRAVTVPYLVEMTVDQVRTVVEKAGLTLKEPFDEDFSDTVPAGLVIRSEPGQDEKVKPGTEISVTLSKGKKYVNAAPTIHAIRAPLVPVNIGSQPVSIEVVFSDPEVSDTHAVIWKWGDGTITGQDGATTPVTASHTYAAAGVYAVTVTVTDNDGGSDSLTYQPVEIYDASAGSVTGSGWIDSPYGAYRQHKDLPFFNGHYYQVVSSNLTWAKASAAASASKLEGCGSAHLATITSQEEQDAIYASLGGNAIASAWLGARLKDGAWQWITGEPWNYTNWHPAEPSGLPENALHIGASGSNSPGGWIYDGKWNDLADTGTKPYIVEYEQCGPTGRASFDFISKVQKGTGVPTGDTEFQFQAAGLNFQSGLCEQIAIIGGKYARYEGMGTINGEGATKFLLWAGDGTGTNGVDTFRIKIWSEDSQGLEAVIYDNGMDQDITGGSIVVDAD